MSEPRTMTPYQQAIAELGAVMERVDDAAVDAACRTVAEAGTVVLYACGREGLQLRGFCMRLFHMGRRVAMVGDMTTPPLGPEDLFFVVAGPGWVSTSEALMKVAREAGARTLLVTAEPEARLKPLADQVLLLPAQTMASDQSAAASRVLPMGSAMEGALFVLFEVMVFKLKAMLGVTAEAMRAKHTNME